MHSFKKKIEPISNIDNGISSLQVAMAAKKSMNKNKAIKLRNLL